MTMRIEFEQRPEDLYAFYEFVEWEDPEKKWKRWKITFLPASITFILMLLVARNHGVFRDEVRALAFGILVLVAALVILAVTPGWVKHRLHQKVEKVVQASERMGIFGIKILDIDAKGIRVSNANTEVFYSWKKIKGFRQTPRYFFLYLHEHRAIIIPKIIFELEEKGEFEQIVQRNILVKS
jgi:hypothetical protein